MKVQTIPMILLFVVGCRGLDRITNGGNQDSAPSPQVSTSRPDLGDAPEFNVPTPAGTTRVVYFGSLPMDGVVSFQGVANSTVRVFMKQLFVGQWFVIGEKYSEAFWYTYDAAKGTVTYHGQHLDNIAFCVYQYIPEARP